MNPTSVIFALSMAAIVAATGWFIDWGAGKYGGWSSRKRKTVRLISVIATLVTGWFVYVTDANLRGTTLFEVAGPWSENGGRIWKIEVEHPGVEHSLLVSPFTRGFDSADRPLTLRVRFMVEGEPPLLDATSVHETETRSQKSSSAMTWKEANYVFTPTRAGTHELIVDSADGVVPPLLHLRIADPEKRDGKRAQGY